MEGPTSFKPTPNGHGFHEKLSMVEKYSKVCHCTRDVLLENNLVLCSDSSHLYTATTAAVKGNTLLNMYNIYTYILTVKN